MLTLPFLLGTMENLGDIGIFLSLSMARGLPLGHSDLRQLAAIRLSISSHDRLRSRIVMTLLLITTPAHSSFAKMVLDFLSCARLSGPHTTGHSKRKKRKNPGVPKQLLADLTEDIKITFRKEKRPEFFS